MKKNKGFSLITLIITIIVIIIIVSIGTYNGINLVKETRKKDSEDRLRIICGAILKDDTFLNFSGDTEVTLDRTDYDYMDLLNYYDEGNVVRVIKDESNVDTTKTIKYTLVMTNLKDGNDYTYEFDYNIHTDKYSYDISFNEAKGVNRPVLVSGMVALMPDGKTEVEDVYTSNWYNYEKNRANFAKMKYEDKIYVWIPRFAYDIQNFYEGRKANGVPSTAISIVFLRENSSYMQNDEVMQGEYKVHPAFIKDGTHYSGIWVEESAINGNLSLPSSPLYEEIENGVNIHMMTNMECGAAIYLMYALEEMDQIMFEDDEYVAACADGLGVFDDSNGYVTAYTLNESGDINLGGIYGDAFFETPWDRILEEYPTEEKRYVIRKFDSGLFDFTNSNGTDSATYRGVITIK